MVRKIIFMVGTFIGLAIGLHPNSFPCMRVPPATQNIFGEELVYTSMSEKIDTFTLRLYQDSVMGFGNRVCYTTIFYDHYFYYKNGCYDFAYYSLIMANKHNYKYTYGDLFPFNNAFRKKISPSSYMYKVITHYYKFEK